MYALSDITCVGINFSCKTICHLWVSLIVSGLDILLCWLLVPLFGARGAAIAFGGSYIFFLIFRTLFGFHYFRFKIDFLKNLLILTGTAAYAVWTTFVPWCWYEIPVALLLIFMILWFNRLSIGAMYRDLKKLLLNQLGKSKEISI